MNKIYIIEILYTVVLLFTVMRVIFDTRNSSKALAYIMFMILVPVVGILFYFSFGVNYRKRKIYNKKIITDENARLKVQNRLSDYHNYIKESGLLSNGQVELSDLINNTIKSSLTASNSVRLLVNGEGKYSKLLDALRNAKHHIHIEYYIFEDDHTGNEVAELLMQKSLAGVKVRFIYDDFGSHSIRKGLLKRLEDCGVEVAPFYKINLFLLASRINYRNHRKVVVIDGTVSFVGGINISDKYRNDTKEKGGIYWRDTHLQITGIASGFLQALFISDWNFCSNQSLGIDAGYFPQEIKKDLLSPDIVQIVSAGPDSEMSVLFYSLIKAISIAEKQILITNPYFIPGDSLMDALKVAAGSGIRIKLIVPDRSDSKIVNAAACSYYSELLPSGVEIYRYQKGFVHAKTMVVDDDLSIVGTANMDYRSFDLNFEVNAIIYNKRLALELTQTFEQDLLFCSRIDPDKWFRRPKYIRLWEKTARLLSPFL